jgi:hypothetical protein
MTEAPASSAIGTWSSRWSWKISCAPDAAMRGPYGRGSPKDSMIAGGRRSSTQSSADASWSSRQRMKPQPTRPVSPAASSARVYSRRVHSSSP